MAYFYAKQRGKFLLLDLDTYEMWILKKIVIRVSLLAEGVVRRMVWRHFVLAVTGMGLLAARWVVMGSTVPRFMKVDNPSSFLDSVLFRVSVWLCGHCFLALLTVMIGSWSFLVSCSVLWNTLTCHTSTIMMHGQKLVYFFAFIEKFEICLKWKSILFSAYAGKVPWLWWWHWEWNDQN